MHYLDYFLKILNHFSWLGNGIFLILAFIESAPFIGVFIPGATLISVGGFLASQNYFNVWNIVMFAALGAILGDFSSYFLGRWGSQWLKNKKLINANILKKGEAFFERYGNKSVFWGRFFGPIRAVIPFIAGLAKMKQRSFLFWNISSAIIWALLNVFLGYFSGTIFVFIFKKWSLRLIVIFLILTIIISFIWLVKKKHQRIVDYFKSLSKSFVDYLKMSKIFKKLSGRYHLINDFFQEENHAEEKIFTTAIIIIILIIVFTLNLIFDLL